MTDQDDFYNSRAPPLKHTPFKPKMPKIAPNSVGEIAKGGNFDKSAPQMIKQRRKLKMLAKMPEKEFLVRGVNKESQVVFNESYNVFNSFRKYNYDLINRAKLALVEVLTPECMAMMAYMDSNCMDELQSKIETRLLSFIKAEIYLNGDLMKLKKNNVVVNNLDFRSMPEKTYITENFKFKLRDLKLDVNKIV